MAVSHILQGVSEQCLTGDSTGRGVYRKRRGGVGAKLTAGQQIVGTVSHSE